MPAFVYVHHLKLPASRDLCISVWLSLDGEGHDRCRRTACSSYRSLLFACLLLSLFQNLPPLSLSFSVFNRVLSKWGGTEAAEVGDRASSRAGESSRRASCQSQLSISGLMTHIKDFCKPSDLIKGELISKMTTSTLERGVQFSKYSHNNLCDLVFLKNRAIIDHGGLFLSLTHGLEFPGVAVWPFTAPELVDLDTVGKKASQGKSLFQPDLFSGGQTNMWPVENCAFLAGLLRRTCCSHV